MEEDDKGVVIVELKAEVTSVVIEEAKVLLHVLSGSLYHVTLVKMAVSQPTVTPAYQVK